VASGDDVRRLMSRLAEAVEGPMELRFAVRGRPLTWAWQERVADGRRRIPNPDVLAVRVSGEARKQDLLALDAGIFFTEPHYDGYPAILVRLSAIDLDLLEELLRDAWRIQAPKALVRVSEPSPPSR
jgi:hypothetical protein